MIGALICDGPLNVCLCVCVWRVYTLMIEMRQSRLESNGKWIVAITHSLNLARSLCLSLSLCLPAFQPFIYSFIYSLLFKPMKKIHVTQTNRSFNWISWVSSIITSQMVFVNFFFSFYFGWMCKANWLNSQSSCMVRCAILTICPVYS